MYVYVCGLHVSYGNINDSLLTEKKFSKSSTMKDLPTIGPKRIYNQDVNTTLRFRPLLT